MVLLIFLISIFLFSISLISSLIFIICLLLAVGINCSYISSFLGWKLRLLIFDLFSFLIYACNGINFSFKPCFCCIPQLLVSCIFILIQLKIFKNFSWDPSVTHVVFKNVLFNFQIFEDFSSYLCYWFLV